MSAAPRETFNLLIVDDDVVFREHLAQHFAFDGREEYGIEFLIREASEAVAFERIIREESFDPDVILLDIDFTEAGGGPYEGIEYILPRMSALRVECGRPRAVSLIFMVSGQNRSRDWERDVSRVASHWGAFEFRRKSDGVLSGPFLEDVVRTLRSRSKESQT